MNRIQTACYCLIASGVVLAGLLAVQVAQRTGPNEAHAEMVIARDQFTIMTAQTRDGEEGLFVLDNNTGSLLVYRLNISDRTLEPAGGVRIDQIFNAGGGDTGNTRQRR